MWSLTGPVHLSLKEEIIFVLNSCRIEKYFWSHFCLCKLLDQLLWCCYNTCSAILYNYYRTTWSWFWNYTIHLYTCMYILSILSTFLIVTIIMSIIIIVQALQFVEENSSCMRYFTSVSPCLLLSGPHRLFLAFSIDTWHWHCY